MNKILKICKRKKLQRNKLQQRNKSNQQVGGIKIFIFNDMEFDYATGRENRNATMHEHIRKKYKKMHIQIPTIVYWALRAFESIFVADTNMIGVSLLSGYSAGLMRKFLNNQLELTKEIEVDVEDMESESEDDEAIDTDDKLKDKKAKAKKENGEKKTIKVELTPLETLLALLDMESSDY